MTQLSTGEAPADLNLPAALAAALATVRRNIAVLGDRYPDDTTEQGRYPLRAATEGIAEGGNWGWTTSFWSGRSFTDPRFSPIQRSNPSIFGGESL